MAEESVNSSGAWWGSVSGFVNAAKNKSAEVLEFVKRDLDELSTTVKNEATNVVSTTTSALKESFSFDDPESTANNMKRSVSTFLGTVSNVLNPVPEDDDEIIIMKDDVPLPLTRFQSRLHTLVSEDETFTAAPEGPEATQFTAWLEIQDDILNSCKLSSLMIKFPEIRAKYSVLVPSKVCHADFWKHFLFRKALLEDEEARFEAAVARKEAEIRQLAQEAEAKQAPVQQPTIPVLQFSDAFKVRFQELLSDDEPFTVLLQGEEEVRFKAWMEIQDQDIARSNKNKSLMAAFPELKTIRSRLVPDVMPNADFWRRVWFRKALLEDELAILEAAEAKKESKNRQKSEEAPLAAAAASPSDEPETSAAEPVEGAATGEEDDDGDLDASDERHRLETLRADEYEDYLLSQVDDFAVNMDIPMDIPEEEQMRLLQEYEHECKTRRSSNGQKRPDAQKRPSVDNVRGGQQDETTKQQPLPLEEDHYSNGQAKVPNIAFASAAEVTSLLDNARDRIFSLVKTAMDTLELAEPEEDEPHDDLVRSPSSAGGGEVEGEGEIEGYGDDENVIERLVVKERADMVIVGATGISPPTSESCSGDKESNYDDWERLEQLEADENWD